MPNKEEIAVSSEEMAIIAIWVVDKRWLLDTVHYYDPAVKLLTTEAIILQMNTELQSMCWSLTPTPNAEITIKSKISVQCAWTYVFLSILLVPNLDTPKLHGDAPSKYYVCDVAICLIT